jgi:hypothetical protein
MKSQDLARDLTEWRNARRSGWPPVDSSLGNHKRGVTDWHDDRLGCPRHKTERRSKSLRNPEKTHTDSGLGPLGHTSPNF